MKKVIIGLFFITLILIFKTSNEDFVIPSDAIRFRVIANSNTIKDQYTKIQIKNDIEDILRTDLLKATSKDKAKTTIKNKLPEIESTLKNYQVSYKINLGSNYFPEKKYQGLTYPSGMYDSLVITLGSGAGENWWCVLYPPLCLMDTSKLENNEVEYKSFVQEIFNKYL